MEIKVKLDGGEPVEAKVKAKKKLKPGEQVFLSLQPKVWIRAVILSAADGLVTARTATAG